jgi:putative thioredoxin
MANTPYILAATRESFPELVLENSRRGPVLVDFWSPRVGPCQRQREMLTRLAESLAGRFLLVTMNTDQERDLARDYGVRSLPSCKLFRHGRVVEELRGVQPEADYRSIVERHLGHADAVQRAALEAWGAGEQERALGILAEGAMAEPENAALPLLMAKLLVQQGRPEDAQRLLATLPAPARDDPQIEGLRLHLEFIAAAAAAAAAAAPALEVLHGCLAADPDNHGARYELAAVLLVGDDLDGALEQLLELAQRAPGFRDGIARRGLLGVLGLMDPADERVRRMRSALLELPV